jgi:tetratricopeptide (TPR) repeat protein
MLDTASDWFQRHDAGTRWAAVGLSFLVVGMAATFVGFIIVETFDGWGRQSAEAITDRSLAEQRAVLEQRPPVRRALREYDRGAIEEGIERLEALDAEPYRDNPHLEYVIGRGFAERGDWKKSLGHFERVVELDPRYVEDRRFLRDLLKAFESEQENVVERVRELLRPRLDRPVVRSVVGRTAWRSSVPRTRRRAHALLEETGVLEELPKWMQHAVALRRAEGCSEHRKRIQQLVEHSDTRGLPILRIYRTYPDSIVGCVREEIDDGIRTLEDSSDGDG